MALECAGARLLIDCPHPIRKILAEAGAPAGMPLDVADHDAAASLIEPLPQGRIHDV